MSYNYKYYTQTGYDEPKLSNDINKYDHPYAYEPSKYSQESQKNYFVKSHHFYPSVYLYEDYSTPYDLNQNKFREETTKKSGYSPEKHISTSDYSYREVKPYDYHYYKPLEETNLQPKVVYERVISYQDNFSPSTDNKRNERLKKSNHFHDYHVPEYELTNQMIDKLDEMKGYISDLKQKVTDTPYSSPSNSKPKPHIFEYEQPKYEFKVIESEAEKEKQKRSYYSPVKFERVDHIKKSGLKASPLKSPLKSIRTNYKNDSYFDEYKNRSPQKNKIFSPLLKATPPENPDIILDKIDSPKYYKERTKRSPVNRNNYQTKKYFSQEIVVPSKNPIFEIPEQKIHIKKAKTSDMNEINDNIYCIDCEQYIKVGNANLHSLFCFKSIENKHEGSGNSKIRDRLRNIIFFLDDEMARIKNKYGEKLEKFFIENFEDLKKCLNDILECKREIEIHSLIDRLHYINLGFDKVVSPYGAEIKRLGLKAEDDLNG